MSGLFLANPDGLWGLAAVAAVAVLYLFYRRHRPQAVTGLFLWGDPRRENAGGRKVEKPLASRSFLLDILAAALLGLSLAGPAWRSDSRMPLVIVLDDSFAMRARDADAGARRIAGELLGRAASRGVDAALILAGERPVVLRGPGALPGSVSARLLDAYRPASEKADLQAAVLFASNLYGPALDIHVVTNREQGPVAASANVTTHILPGCGGNLAFAGAWREAGDRASRERLVVRAVNFGSRETAANLVVAIDQPSSSDALYSQRLVLPPGGAETVEVALSLVDDDVLVARLESDFENDVIPDDSIVYLPPTPIRTVTYAVDDLGADAVRYFTLGLEAAGCVPAPWSGEGEPEGDILITDDPARRGRVLTVEMKPARRPGVFAPPYVVDVASPLCRDVSLAAVPWVAADAEITGDPEGQTFIQAGSVPLYWRSRSGRLHLNLLPERSLIVNDAAWPVLMSNLVSLAAARLPGLGKTAYRPGEPLRYRRGTGGERGGLALYAGDRPIAPLVSGESPLPRNPGPYLLRDGERDVGSIAVLPLFGDASNAGDLSDAEKTLHPVVASEETGRGAADLTWLVLAVGFGLLALNWLLGSGRRER